MALKQQCFALTICAYKKPEMEEEDYHNYVSEQHAPKLKDLLVKNKIVDYTMVRLLSVLKISVVPSPTATSDGESRNAAAPVEKTSRQTSSDQSDTQRAMS